MAQAVWEQTIDQDAAQARSEGAGDRFNKFASAAAVLMAAIIIIQFVVFMVEPAPLDGSAIDWFLLFQRNPLIGLIDFELLMVAYMIISVPVALALFRLLKSTSPAFMMLYLALSLTGVMAFIAARPAFEMLSLSNAYAVAATEAEKSLFLAAGQSLVATFHGTAFHVSYILGSLTGLILSLVMLKSRTFSRTTAYLRIASSLCDFGLYLPVVGLYISMFSVVFLFIWNILIARRLFQLGRSSQN